MLRGMKRTEIGLIPEDWEVYSIEKLVADKILEKPLDGNHGNIHPKSCDFVDEGIPFIMASDVYNNRINFSTCYHITKLQADKLQKGFSISGDVLLTHKGTVGNTAIVPEISFPYIMLTPQVTYYRVLDFCRLNNIFLENVLDSKNLQDQIDSISGSGATRAYIGITQQRTLQIPLPPLPEQEAIAGALSDADAWVESLEQLIAKKRLIKQGAMQELLMPKEGWEVKTIFEIADNKRDLFNDGDWIESEHIVDEGIRLVQTGNIGIGKFLNKANRKYINELSFNKLKCKELREGDLLICRLAEPAGRACLFPKTDDYKSVTSVDVTIYRPDVQKYDRRFLLFSLSTDHWFTDVIEQVGGTTHKRISRGNLGRIKISVPQLTEQTRIATILSDMDAELEALKQQLAKARQIKQGMMQELLTGRVRLI
ncbi:restriction endonuclease subunit S [Chryseobacterium sp. H3056]|uniref:Restriction endonuclease subunit S n=1 Tax=Kaistella daneshvariae TaxID=2487074 RepID=A0A3N0X070_9FLAO|nr:restriction endonuclease subunit S [Kaistella daneshvariae]ROI10784.1 restriction endonuclease subunit S [Kaistella daneshvariae]